MNLTNLIKREIKIVIVSIFCFLLTVFGLSYGFLTSDNNDLSTDLSVGSATFPLILSDNTTITETDILAGDTLTKTITVQNRGNRTVSYNLIWVNLLNEIELEISATCSSSVQGNTCSAIAAQVIPMRSTETNNDSIKQNISIAAGETHTYVVTIKFIDEEDLQQEYDVIKHFHGKINIEEGAESGRLALTTDQGSSGLDTGDIVTITRGNNISENFYVISANASETVLFAKYNLLVGDVEEYDENEIYSASPLPVDSNYGLQSVNAKAYDENSNQWIGTVAFSGSNYWHNEATDDVYSKYGTYTNYANDVYDPDYNEPPSMDYSDEFPVPTEENYSIAYYVEEYVNKLGINGTGRLLKYSEAISLGCITSDSCFSAPSWVYTSSYFLGSVTSAETVWIIDSSGYFVSGDGFFNAGGIYGVRPVIVVSTSDIIIN